MQEIYSKVAPDILLARIMDVREAGWDRTNLSELRQGLQTAIIKAARGRQFAPHRHKPLDRTTQTTQEVWVVLAGVVLVSVYDVNDELMAEVKAESPCVAAFYLGGHGFTMEEDAVVVEVKNGPYLGAHADKEWISGVRHAEKRDDADA